MNAHIAFVSSPELRHDSEALIDHVEAGHRAPQADLMVATIGRFADEILQAFFVDLISLLHLSPLLTAAVSGTVATVKAAVHGIARAVIHKLDNRQLLPLAEYMGGVMLTAPDTSGDPTPYVGFPVSTVTHQRLDRLLQDMRRSDPKAHEAELASVLREITDRALDAYMLTPIELLKLGLILRKTAEGGVRVIRNAIHLMIRKVLPDLDGTQLLAVAQHLNGMVLAHARPLR